MEKRVEEIIKKATKNKIIEGSNIHEGLDWSNAILDGFNIRDVRLSTQKKNANFLNVSLKKAKLERVELVKANLRGVNLKGTKIKDSNFSNSCFKSSNITKAIIEKSQFSYCDFGESVLFDSKFIDCFLEGSSFFQTKLGNVNLESANLFNCIFRDCRINEIKFGKKDINEKEGKYNKSEYVYRTLKNLYKEDGNYNKEAEFYLKERRVRRKQLFKNDKIRWFIDLSYSWVNNYGESISRVLLTSFLIILFFSGLFYLSKGIKPVSISDLNYAPSVSESIYFSSATFIPWGYGDYLPKNNIIRIFAVIEAFLGVFMMAVLVATFVRKGTR